jgi:hypothetical protein
LRARHGLSHVVLKDVIPPLTRPSLHAACNTAASASCRRRIVRSRTSLRKLWIGYFHIDIAELRYEGGKGFHCRRWDRTSKLVFARIYRKGPCPIDLRHLQRGFLLRADWTS